VQVALAVPEQVTHWPKINPGNKIAVIRTLCIFIFSPD
jgi:hypothetical protein